MKGMASLGGDNPGIDGVSKQQVEQHMDTEVIEDGFLLPKKHLR